MIKKRTPLILLFLAFSPWFVHAQCPAIYTDFLDGNKVKAGLSNGGDHFWDFFSTASYEVPAGSGASSLFASSMWVGGLDFTSQLHVAANTYRQQGTDFYAGPYRTTGNYLCGHGFTANGNVFDRGLVPLLSGKAMATYPNGFSVYDPVSATSTDYLLPQNRSIYDVVELADGRLLLYGDDNYPTLNDAMIIDSSSFTATSIGQLNYFHRWSSSTRLLNGQMLLAGILGCEIFDPVSNTSTPVAPMGRMRVKHAATLLPNGNVLVVGGGAGLGGSGATPTTEIYNPASNTWTNGPSLNWARNSPEITKLSNGNYLISGGTSTFLLFDLYDPVTNTITAVTGADFPFNEHSAIPLASGEILFSTNGPNGGYPGSRIFRYDPVTQLTNSTNIIGGSPLATRLAGGNVLMELDDNQFLELDPNLKAVEGQRWQKSWKLSASQISQFIADWQNNQVNFANYPDIQTWPAHGDTSQGEDLHLAPFVDVNMDGRYRPLADGDYPCIEGDQAIWWAYNDDGPHGETMGAKMGIQVESMAYAYDCNSTQCPDSFLNYSTLYHHEITNKSGNDYTEVYIGMWMDFDLGYFADDLIGSDSALSMGFAYNGDNSDVDTHPNKPGTYGDNPPAIGMVVLDNGELPAATNFMSYNNDFTIQGNPDLPMHYYNYLRSRWKDGSRLVDNGGDGYAGTQAGPATDWMYPGDAGFCGTTATGWSEVSAGNTPFDRRGVLSVGPFDLEAGEKIEFDFALIWARGSDHLNSVCRLKSATASIKSWWESNNHGCFNIVLSNEPAPLTAGSVHLYPNPSDGNFRVALDEAMMADAALTIYDISGRQVHQELIPAQTRSKNISQRDLSEGIYLVHIQMTNGSITKKMVVQH